MSIYINKSYTNPNLLNLYVKKLNNALKTPHFLEREIENRDINIALKLNQTLQQKWPNLQQRLQRIRHELPSKQKAQRNAVVSIISTVKTETNPVQKFDRNLPPPKSPGMRTVFGPINPRNGSVGIPVRQNNIN